jgi:hypothetical protein
MNDLELEMLIAELVRRGRDRDGIIFVICREHDLQWSEVAPIVDHVISTQTNEVGLNQFGVRPILLLAGLVIGGGLMLTAGLDAFGLAKMAVPQADLWELIHSSANFIFRSPRLWSQLLVGGIAFAFSLGWLLFYVSRLRSVRKPPVSE